MYCVVCGQLSWHIICKSCLHNIWHVDSKRILHNNVKVFSSFAFSELKFLLASKNHIIGSRIFKCLGYYGVYKFFASYPNLAALHKKYIAVISIRNHTIGAYSHSAILAQCFQKYGFQVFHNALIIGNNSRFAFLGRQEREKIGRNFHFTLKKEYESIILVDDIITTGQTLFEASQILMQNNHTPLFAWTLCDSRY